MRKTNEYKVDEVLAVDIKGLQGMLSCGANTAKDIATKAKAIVPIGGRRCLYSVEKIREYLNNESV